MSTQKVDVLAVMDTVANEYGMHDCSELRKARAAVADLIEASNAMLDGSIAQVVATDHPDMSQADKDEAAWRAWIARDAMRSALARIGVEK